MKRLGDSSYDEEKKETVRPNEVATRLIEMGKIQMCKDHTRTTITKLKRQKKLLQQDAIVGAPFTPSEVDIALIKTKVNKAAGFDGIYTEFVKYACPRIHE